MDDKRRSATAVAGARVNRQEELVSTIKAAVAEAVAEREERQLEELTAKPKKTQSALAFLIVVLLGFVGSGLYAYFEMKAMSVPLEEELGMENEAVGVHLYSVAIRLERFKQENGHYPASLSLVGVPADKSLEYTLVSADEFRLVYTDKNLTRTYSSTHPSTSLLSRGVDLRH
jgi:hypothetical protein